MRHQREMKIAKLKNAKSLLFTKVKYKGKKYLVIAVYENPKNLSQIVTDLHEVCFIAGRGYIRNVRHKCVTLSDLTFSATNWS